QGTALDPDALPLMVALTQRRPAHGSLWIHALDSVPRHIEVIAFPLNSQTGQTHGAVAIFWESREP
ncbi:hypothetical protein, partial [Salmonella sp. SAL4356]|uniref:hypothetical protein n=1 Tax=Salmonella sp. SAL4356 TaxID=3159877 RepID=UPI00397981A3